MPAFSTHYIFANSLIGDIKKADTSIELNVSALYYGTQGPDFLFSHRILPTMKGKSLRPLGSELHHCDPAKLFSFMGEYLRTKPCDKAIVKSYIYGFICHFSLDRKTHPYIYALQKELTAKYRFEKYPSFVMHNIIELNIDMLLLERFLGVEDTRGFRTYSTMLKDDHLINEISRLMAYAVPRVIGSTADAGDYRTAFLDTITIQKLFTDEKGWINPLFSAVQLPLRPFIGPAATSFIRHKKSDGKADYLNTAKTAWQKPAYPDEYSTKSFDELFSEAQADALNIIGSFDGAMDGKTDFDALTQNMSFDTGTRFDVAVELH